MSTLYFFTGENTFRLREERRKWVSGFTDKHGSENLLTLDGGKVSYRELLDEVSIAPFIAAKRLVVLDGMPKLSKEEAEALPGAIHPDCLVLIVDPKPDKRLGGTKVILKVADVKEFAVLQGAVVCEWVKQYAVQCGASILPDAIARLLDIVGEDQDMLSQEIQKLCTACPGASITVSDVEALAVPSGEREIWHLTNLLAAGKTQDALLYTKRLTAQGEDPFSLWAILLWMLKNLVSVYAAVQEGNRNPATIASLAGVPFPSVRTLLPYVEKLSLPELRSFLNWAVETDILLKTGGYKSTGEAPQELAALTDQFIVRCGSLVSR